MKNKTGILFTLLFITGCGNSLSSGIYLRGTPSTSGSSGGGLLAACTNSSNIKPVITTDWGTFNSGTFSACLGAPSASGASGTQLQLYSQYTSTSKQWCFVPAISTIYGRTYINIPGSQQPMTFCAQAENQSAKMTIPSGTQFNSGYVFSIADQSQMSTCLMQKNISACPRYYSFGSVQ